MDKKYKSKTISWREYYDSLPEKQKTEIENGRKFYEILYALREKREKLGLTQEDIANKTGIPRETINKIESGRRNITLGKLIKITKAIGLEIKFV